MKLRHDHPALQSGDLKEATINDSIFAFTRTSKDNADSLLILLNSSNQDQPVPLTNAADGALPRTTSLREIFAMQPGPANQVTSPAVQRTSLLPLRV